MSYQIFLRFLSQLSTQACAKVELEGRELRIYKKEKKWILSTTVFQAEGFIPKNIRECVSSAGILRWQEKGAFLKLDPFTDSVFLIQEVTASSLYLPFKSLMIDFIQNAEEWQQILRELAEQECIPIFH